MKDKLRLIPSVESMLQSPHFEAIIHEYGRGLVLYALQEEIKQIRSLILRSEFNEDVGKAESFVVPVKERISASLKPSLQKVLNGTGVILHTNLGRAILADEALEAMRLISAGYSNLEYDVSNGIRGSRYDHCTRLLSELTGGVSALVVNNGAAALVLALRCMADKKNVLVSRGELVEIGGGFRIPEILECSGASLLEVGSTNRTRIQDYKKAAEATNAGVILKVHRSNFNMTGFTEETSLEELVELGTEMNLPVIYDLGSGLLQDPKKLGLPTDEPTPRESLEAGADIVIFSGDKLLGGPQSGILIGKGIEWIDKMRRNPLCRALRVDKTTLASLEATLSLHRDPELALTKIPILKMLNASIDELTERASKVIEAVGEATVRLEKKECRSIMGGGTFPEFEIPSIGLEARLPGCSPDKFSQRLRQLEIPLISRVENGMLIIDLRTILHDQDHLLIDCLSGPFS